MGLIIDFDLSALDRDPIFRNKKEIIKSLMTKKINAVYEKVQSEFNNAYKLKLEQMYRNAVDEFYDAYSPEQYDRDYRLYGLLDVSIENNGLDMYVEFNPKEAGFGYRNQYNKSLFGYENGLYNTVFRMGYHGGADKISKQKEDVYGSHPGTGTPYWRTGWGYHKWGNEAFSSAAPIDIFFDSVDEYLEEDYGRDLQSLWDKYSGDLAIDI